MRKNRVLFYIVVPLLILSLNGCALVIQRGRRSDLDKIQNLEQELAELRKARNALESRLSSEIDNDQVSVSMGDRGLVITFVAEVLFDSGKAQLRGDSLPILDKIAGILKEEVPNNNIGVEGHTDNVPIKYSKWSSNWELSAHRALSVVEYLQSQGLDPEKLSATGYGEYRPVASNDSKDGRQKNRRVEIVIVPKAPQKAAKSSRSNYDNLK